MHFSIHFFVLLLALFPLAIVSFQTKFTSKCFWQSDKLNDKMEKQDTSTNKRQKLQSKSQSNEDSPQSSVEVVVVGSSNTDLVAYTDQLPKQGETLHGSKFEVGFGGKGANQAVMAARLGIPVGFVSCLGTDLYGDDYLSHLQKEGVDCRHVRQVPGSTGVAQICVDAEGQNFIVIIVGANGELTPTHVEEAVGMFREAKVVVCQGEISAQSTLAALQLGKKEGLLTVLNTAPADPDLPQEFYEATDILCLNEPELESITRMPTGTLDEIKLAARFMLSKGPRNIVVTMGSEGAFWVNQDSELVVPTEKVKAVDTVGAGDAFVGSMACYLAKNETIEESLRKACRIASLSVMKKGAQDSYPLLSEISKI